VRDAESARKYNTAIEALYTRMDGVIGDVLKRVGDKATVQVMSDHGFTNFRRQFNVNTWLRDNGYINPPDCDNLLQSPTGRNVDWTRTQAYGLGLNGLYVNLRGRERDGIVDPAERDKLLEELSTKLLAVRDTDGEVVISQVYRADAVYQGPETVNAPDLLIGYRRGYRASWATTLGELTPEVLSDNDSAWSADHCMATDEVPGVVFSNRPIRHPAPSLENVAPTILEEFNVPRPPTMAGGSLFQPAAVDVAAGAGKE
jgi:predicted AlkP superfamily phosphohydrolase/phosphomutase